MSTLLLKNPTIRTLSKPFYFLIFLYFLVISAELLHFKALIFKFKINAFVGILLFVVFFLSFRMIRLEKDYLLAALVCFGSLLLSALFGYHLIGCIGFLLFFIFNYLVFFVLPMNMFRVLDSEIVMRLYFLGFVLIGLYAVAQVLFSLFGIILPYTAQRILSMGRGQAFCYEPSYYALYMTPFTMFQTAKYMLQERHQRSLKTVLFSNFLLVVSTSTGCFFSYAALLGSLVVMKCVHLIRRMSLSKIFLRVSLAIASCTALVWFVNPELLIAGLLKFFWAGTQHHSFQDRWKGIMTYWGVFLDHCLLGTGLGGATTYIAQRDGLDVSLFDQDILNINGPMNITLEVMASLGILGMIAFGGFLLLLCRTCVSTLRLELEKEERVTVQALTISLAVMLFTMQFNPSIMRAYTWVHVAISVGYMKGLQRKSQARSVSASFNE